MARPADHAEIRTEQDFTSPAALSLDDKVTIINQVIYPLRNMQALGILETRAWLELLFPEFGQVRDTEADRIFRELANFNRGEE